MVAIHFIGRPVELAAGILRRGPEFPAELGIEDRRVGEALERGLGGAILLEAVEVFQEEELGGLLGVVEFGRAARFLAERVVDIAEGLLKHGR
jgi:hypothetical protein